MSYIPSSGSVPPRCNDISAQASRQTGSGDQHAHSRSSFPVVSERAREASPVLAPTPSLDASAADTLRRLTAVLNGLDPINTVTLQGLRALCEQLHVNQGDIDAAMASELEVAPVPGFRQAVLAFTQRLHAALQGKQPALVLQQITDVEAICLGLGAFASVKTHSPYPARTDLRNKACHALGGITTRLLAIVEQQQGVQSMRYGQMLTMHNWISRACKAKLLKADSDCMQEAKAFSSEAFGEFLRLALVWDTDGRQSMRLNEHDLGKTAAELKTMLDHGLVSFAGKEESLAQVVAWLSSEQAFTVLLAARDGSGLSSLFSLFKRILDMRSGKAAVITTTTTAATATTTTTTTTTTAAESGAAQNPSQAGPDALNALWNQMIASIAFLNSERLLHDDGRFLASCVNLLRAMHESGLPRGWSTDQCLAFANTGRRLLNMVAGSDPTSLSCFSLQTLANLVSFIKAWHKYELQAGEGPASYRGQVPVTPGKRDKRPVMPGEILARLRTAAKQLAGALPQFELAQLETPETVGGLLKGLSYLRSTHLLAVAVTDPLLTELANAVAAIPSWERRNAVEIAKCLNVLFGHQVTTWEALQPAFVALMGQPAELGSWTESDVAAFVRGEITTRQALDVPLERYVKPVSSAQAKPEKKHVVGDRLLKASPVVITTSNEASSSAGIFNFSGTGKPRYRESDPGNFLTPMNIAKAIPVSQEAVRSREALLAPDREIEQEEDEQPSANSASDKEKTAQRTAREPLVRLAGRDNKGSRKKNRALAAPARKRDDDIPLPPPETFALPRNQMPKTTPLQRRAMAKELFAAISENNEAKALMLLAGPGGNQIAGYLSHSDVSLLHEAIHAQMPSVINAVLAFPEGKNRSTHADKYGLTPLYLAVSKGNMTILESLLALDAVAHDATRRTITGHHAVAAAIEENKAVVLERLMRIDVVHKQLPRLLDGQGKTMVEIAVESRSVEALRILLTHPELVRQAASPVRFGFQQLSLDKDSMSLARCAANRGDLPTVSALTEITAVRQFEGASKEAFNLAGMALHSGNAALFDHLLQFPELHRLAGMRTASGCTPLMLAVRANDAKLFARLLQIPEVRSTVLSSPGKKYSIPLEWPANLSAEPFEYGDVLELAVKKRQSAMVGALLQVQQVIDAINTRGDYAQKVLLLLITRSMPGPLEALLQHPIIAKIACIADSTGKTALHHAAHRGRHDVVQLLLQKLPASEIIRSDAANKTAADLARESGHGGLADFLTSVAGIRRAMGTQ